MATDCLDTSGMKCPLPVLKAQKAMRGLADGDILEVIATDPGALKDFPHFCETQGHDLITSEESETGVYRFVIRKKSKG